MLQETKKIVLWFRFALIRIPHSIPENAIIISRHQLHFLQKWDFFIELFVYFLILFCKALHGSYTLSSTIIKLPTFNIYAHRPLNPLHFCCMIWNIINLCVHSFVTRLFPHYFTLICDCFSWITIFCSVSFQTLWLPFGRIKLCHYHKTLFSFPFCFAKYFVSFWVKTNSVRANNKGNLDILRKLLVSITE